MNNSYLAIIFGNSRNKVGSLTRLTQSPDLGGDARIPSWVSAQQQDLLFCARGTGRALTSSRLLVCMI